MSTWIVFNELRTKLRFLEVLEHYSIKVTVKGERATGFCPLPTHQGQRRSPSFSVNLERGIWQCFGCQAKGNVLDFCCRMEGFNPDNPRELRTAALKIRDVFQVGGNASTPPTVTKLNPPWANPTRQSQSALINEPIDFELRTLDPDHPYLIERGFTDETIRRFGLGYCNRGMLKGRVAIPLHDPQGRLVGYAGRITKDEMIGPKCPKYLFPGEREKNGVKLEFRKSLLLYNAHRINAPVDHLFVVEGFPAVWWLHQNGFEKVVALMGSSCSVEQAEEIVKLVPETGIVWIVSDGDIAGEHCAVGIFKAVAPRRRVRWPRLDRGKQPTSLDQIALKGLLPTI